MLNETSASDMIASWVKWARSASTVAGRFERLVGRFALPRPSPTTS